MQNALRNNFAVYRDAFRNQVNKIEHTYNEVIKSTKLGVQKKCRDVIYQIFDELV